MLWESSEDENCLLKSAKTSEQVELGYSILSHKLIYGVSVEGGEMWTTTFITPSETPLGDILSPSAKQPLESYQMELG